MRWNGKPGGPERCLHYRSNLCFWQNAPAQAQRLLKSNGTLFWLLTLPMMHVAANATELQLRSPLPWRVMISLMCTGVMGTLYAYRCLVSEIPPQDHVALSLLLCMMLLNSWRMMDTVQIRFSLTKDRCWVRRTRFGHTREHSVPLSQIHSARFTLGPSSTALATAYCGTITLITSLGVIPVFEQQKANMGSMRELCEQINAFLASRNHYLTA